MLAGVDAFVTTSEHVRAVHRDALPAIGERPFEVIPHGRTLVQRARARRRAASRRPGADPRARPTSSAHKGAEYLREIKRHAGERIELHFLGDVPERYADLGVVHGRYRPEELAERVAAIAPAVIGLFSIVAETFSHALTEAWALGIPVVATDLGAFGERLREHEGGWLIPPDDAAAGGAAHPGHRRRSGGLPRAGLARRPARRADRRGDGRRLPRACTRRRSTAAARLVAPAQAALAHVAVTRTCG